MDFRIEIPEVSNLSWKVEIFGSLPLNEKKDEEKEKHFGERKFGGKKDLRQNFYVNWGWSTLWSIVMFLR